MKKKYLKTKFNIFEVRSTFEKLSITLLSFEEFLSSLRSESFYRINIINFHNFY